MLTFSHLLAMSHFENKDYVSSGAYFSTYYNRYPRGRYYSCESLTFAWREKAP